MQVRISFPSFQSQGYGCHIDSSALAEMLYIEPGIDLLHVFRVYCGTNVLTGWRYKCSTVQSQHHPSILDLWVICLLLLCQLRVSLRPCLARFSRMDGNT